MIYLAVSICRVGLMSKGNAKHVVRVIITRGKH